jgi:hypothetical protein
MVAFLGTPNDDEIEEENEEEDVVGVTSIVFVFVDETPNGCLFVVVFIGVVEELFVVATVVVVIFVLFADLLRDNDEYKESVVFFFFLLLFLLSDVVFVLIGLSFVGVEKYGATFDSLLERTDDFSPVVDLFDADAVDDKDTKDAYKFDVGFDTGSDILLVTFLEEENFDGFEKDFSCVSIISW